jgi:hypothetical protein
MNHKRGRCKNRRAGCLMCKPWKVNGIGELSNDAESGSSHKSRYFAEKDLKEFTLSAAEKWELYEES